MFIFKEESIKEVLLLFFTLRKRRCNYMVMILCVLLLTCAVISTEGSSSHEIDILWEKYGNLKAEMEELKANFRHLEDRLSTKGCGSQVSGSHQDVTTVGPKHGGATITSDGYVDFGFELRHASMSYLGNDEFQYLVEITKPDSDLVQCNFTGITEEELDSNITVSGDVVTGTINLSIKEKGDFTSFICGDGDKFVQLDLSAPHTDRNKTNIARSYSDGQCKMSIPKHLANATHQMIKVNASCEQLQLSMNASTIFGFNINNHTSEYLPYGEYGNNYGFSQHSESSQGVLLTTFSFPHSSHLGPSNLIAFTLNIRHDESSPVKSSMLGFYYSKSFYNHSPPIRAGDVGINLSSCNSKEKLQRGKNCSLICLVIGNPVPQITLTHNGKEVKGGKLPPPNSPILKKYVNHLILPLDNLDENDVGTYECRLRMGNQIIKSTKNFTLCDPIPVFFSCVSNNTMVKATVYYYMEDNNTIAYISCYDSPKMEWKDILGNDVRYDDHYNKIVYSETITNGSMYSENYFWARRRNVPIPTNIYCKIEDTCVEWPGRVETYTMKI